MLWIKTLHVFAVMSWMAGVFYLPRIFVNHAQALSNGEDVARLADMARRLYRFTSILAVLALLMGLILWLYYGVEGLWLHIKLLFVAALVGYHLLCGLYLRRLTLGKLNRSVLFFRLFNELSVLIVFPILVLVIVKPF